MKKVAIKAAEAAPNAKASNYPEPFYSRMLGRQKRKLGDLFELQNFGVNLTRLAPNGQSSLRHAHTKQDEFIYILESADAHHQRRPRSSPACARVSGREPGMPIIS